MFCPCFAPVHMCYVELGMLLQHIVKEVLDVIDFKTHIWELKQLSQILLSLPLFQSLG